MSKNFKPEGRATRHIPPHQHAAVAAVVERHFSMLVDAENHWYCIAATMHRHASQPDIEPEGCVMDFLLNTGLFLDELNGFREE